MADDVFGLVGTAIENKYHVQSVVGEGGFGVVYRGRHLSLGADIAIKCLKVPSHFTPQAQQLFLENFRKEGQLLDRLTGKHPSILRVYDFGVSQSRTGAWVPYLILEWLRGRDLEETLKTRQRPYSEAEAIALLRPAVEAIAKAHGMNPPVAHRDVKPANLFVAETDEGQTLKVLDFGIAKAMQEGETATSLATRTSSGFSAFSPHYGAPEQFMSSKFGPTGPWTDVNALGLIFVHLVTGKAPLEGNTQFELFVPATSPNRPTPRARGARVSDGFEAMCGKAIALHSKDRYKNASELLADMDEVVRVGAALPKPPPPKPQPPPPPPKPKPPEPEPPVDERKPETELHLGTYVVGQPVAPLKPRPVAPPPPPGPRTELDVGTFLPPVVPAKEAPQGKINARTIAIVAGVAVFGVVAAGLMIRSSIKQQEPSAETADLAVATRSATPVATVAATTSEAPATTDVGARHASPTATIPKFVKLQPGTFTMGSPASEKGRDSDETQHRVTLTRAFELKETEVTQGEWQEVMGSNPSRFKECGASCPVEQVSWYDAIAYCNALSVKAGLERCYKDGAKDYDATSATSKTTPEWPKGLDCAGYRMPTEAEWEYAARAGTTGALYTGEVTSPEGTDANVGNAAWYDKNSESKTHAVKQKQGNAWGLYDMLGNVWEWTWDWNAAYGSGEQRDPTGSSTGTNRVERGGSWYYGARYCRAAYRGHFDPGSRIDGLGFRPSRSNP